MQILRRDEGLVKLLADFKQMTGPQLQAALMPQISRQRANMIIRRLKARGWIKPVGQWATGRPGTTPWVWTPTLAGWKLAQKRPHKYTKVIEHMLWTAEVYNLLVAAQQQGLITDLTYRVELPVGSVRPDMYVWFHEVAINKDHAWYIEVEVCAKTEDLIKAKCSGYVSAWVNTPEDQSFPYVLFAPAFRGEADRIHDVMEKLPEHDRVLFKLAMPDEVISTILSPLPRVVRPLGLSAIDLAVQG